MNSCRIPSLWWRAAFGALLLSVLIGCGGGSSAGSPGYAINPTALALPTITAGSTKSSTITISPVNGYTGSVTLSCSVNGASASDATPSCSLTPATVTLSGMSPVAVTLTLVAPDSTPGGTYTVSITGKGADNQLPSNGVRTLTFTAAALIQHIVVIFQENRTPDNLFHDSVLMSRGADIASAGTNSSGETIPLIPIGLGTLSVNPQNYDLAHTHTAFVQMYNGGKMNGADLISCGGPAANCPPNAHPNPQFKYVDPADVQPYFALAEQYTFADRMFQTNEGPSFPAHQFIISGTSAPTATSPLFDAENEAPQYEDYGCLAPLEAVVNMIDAEGSETSQPREHPCFEHPTLTDLLETSGITWRYYTPSNGSLWTGPVAINHICQEQTIGGARTCTGPEWKNSVSVPQTNFLLDIAGGQLAQVTWVIPDGLASDHANVNNGSGPSWVASVVNAIGNSPFWSNTAIFITWDDWGGWYDHVAPKVINDGVSWGSGYVYGFRVPLIVVSPYAKAAYISHVNHDFGSILKFIETTFNLPSLGYADKPADDLSDCFDLTQSPIGFRVIPAFLNASYFIKDTNPPTDPDDD